MNVTGACEACQVWVLGNILRIEVFEPVRMMDDAAFYLENRWRPGGAVTEFHGCGPQALLALLAAAAGIALVFLEVWCEALRQIAQGSRLRGYFQKLVGGLAPGQRSHVTVSHVSFGSVALESCGVMLGLCQTGTYGIWAESRVVSVCKSLAQAGPIVGLSAGGIGFCEDRFGGSNATPVPLIGLSPVLPAGHPLLGGAVRTSDYEVLLAAEVAQLAAEDSLTSLPRSPTFRLAYLVQAARVGELSAAWRHLSPKASLLVLTFRERADGALFFPGSSMNEGRNLLFLAARLAERAQGFRFHYLVMLEPELKFLRGGFSEFEAFLFDWRPAVAVPGYYPAYAAEGHPDYHESVEEEAFAIGRIDFHFVAYHWAAVEELWPMDTRHDAGGCWWGSHWLQQQLMSLKYRGYVIAARRVVVHNEIHASYPKANCVVVQPVLETWLASLLAPEHHHCLLNSNAVRGRAWGAPTRGPPDHQPGHYSPWDAASLGPTCELATKVVTTHAVATARTGVYPLRPSEMLRRPLRVFSPPGNPSCWRGVEPLLLAYDKRNMKMTGQKLVGMVDTPGTAAWRGCCSPFLDGETQIMFGYFPCWSDDEYSFESCCFREMPSTGAGQSPGAPHEDSRALEPLGRQASNPVQFGARWTALQKGACRHILNAFPLIPGLSWYICGARGAMVQRELTFESSGIVSF